MVVDNFGLILAVGVHAADIQDRDSAKLLLEKSALVRLLRVIWTDGGYAGKLVDWVRAMCLGRNARLEIVKKFNVPNFITLLPRRWVVERAHPGSPRYRRLARDYEVKADHSEAFTYVALYSLLARRFVKSYLN